MKEVRESKREGRRQERREGGEGRRHERREGGEGRRHERREQKRTQKTWKKRAKENAEDMKEEREEKDMSHKHVRILSFPVFWSLLILLVFKMWARNDLKFVFVLFLFSFFLSWWFSRNISCSPFRVNLSSHSLFLLWSPSLSLSSVTLAFSRLLLFCLSFLLRSLSPSHFLTSPFFSWLWFHVSLSLCLSCVFAVWSGLKLY